MAGTTDPSSPLHLRIVNTGFVAFWVVVSLVIVLAVTARSISIIESSLIGSDDLIWALISLAYAALALVEGRGLSRRRRWALYLGPVLLVSATFFISIAITSLALALDTYRYEGTLDYLKEDFNWLGILIFNAVAATPWLYFWTQRKWFR
ncbi:MAG: hypothetical protein WD850_02305 [Candidatus Spechtbacterales bacterium]